MMTGLLMLVRRRSGHGDGNSGLIDGLILTVGLALPSWIWLIAPVPAHGRPVAGRASSSSVAYPLGDVILLGAAVRLALDAGRREPAFHLLGASIVLLLATDFVYGIMTLNGAYDHQLWLDAGWIGSYLLWGAAGLHPSMARLDQVVPGREVALTRFRLGLLTCASVIAPIVGLVHDVRVADYDFAVVRVASIALFALVIVRMSGLVRQRDRALHGERVLSATGAELVAAATPRQISEVVVGAARALGGDGAASCVLHPRRRRAPEDRHHGRPLGRARAARGPARRRRRDAAPDAGPRPSPPACRRPTSTCSPCRS